MHQYPSYKPEMKQYYLAKAGKYFTKCSSAMVSFPRVQRNVNSRLSPILAYSRALQCYICRKAFHLRHKKNTSMTMSFDSQKVPSNVIHFRELFCWSPSLLESHMKASALFNNHFTWDICAYFYYNKNKIYFNMYLYIIHMYFPITILQ